MLLICFRIADIIGTVKGTRVTKTEGRISMEANSVYSSRINQIENQLKGLGTSPNQMYTNQEVVDHLKELQSAMARGVFEKTHAENLRDKDIMLHFKMLAEEYGLEQTDTYRRFEANMQDLSHTIGTYIKGMCGERMAKKSLKLLSFDKSIRILYNMQLEDEEVQAEYDAIVVAPYGLFVVEVKNWDGEVTITSGGSLTKNEGGVVCSLADKMSVKEALLREYLQDLFPENYHNILLIPNEKTHVQDDYKRIFVCNGGALSYDIRSFASEKDLLTAEQVSTIAETICAHHKEQRTLCTVKCDEIISDYANLMARIEALAANAEAIADEHIETEELSAQKASSEEKRTEAPKEEEFTKRWYESIDWTGVAAQVAITAAAALAFTQRNNLKLLWRRVF